VLISPLALLAATVWSVPASSTLQVEPAEVRLIGSDSRAQLVVTGRDALGQSVDRTHGPAVRFESLDPGVVRAEEGGWLVPAGDGVARVVVSWEDQSVTVRVTVADFADRRPVSFADEVVPLFTKRGCNAGACHGKTGGQNGFRLSLLGFDPALDYDSLVREGRGRRVFPARPEASLLLRKPTAALPHGGGRRFPVGSPEYRTIARWIGQGMPFEANARPRLERITVWPEQRRLVRGASQQLRVTAFYSDGSTADVTRLAQYQSNAEDLADVDEAGRVEARDGVGEAAIMARFGGQVAVTRATVPRAGETPSWEPPSSRNLIDPLVFGKLRDLGLEPSPACSDREFARRSALDLCGILPDPAEVAAFASSSDPEKRVQWVDRLLERPEYADLFAMKWSAILRNQRGLGAIAQPGTFAFHAWVRQAIAENLPYDQFAAAIVAAKGDPAVHPAVAWYRQVNTLEEQVDDTAQLFLGLRLQCARCHHHPFERWAPDDYYGFASLFSRIGRKPSDDPVTPSLYVRPSGLARNPITKKEQPPRVLGGPDLTSLGPYQDPRQELADWLRRPDNPFFARAVVNRYWKHFFGRGLVEPEDDLRVSNPPSNPELLDALSVDFIAHGFDLKHLVRTIVTSRVYERSSLPTPSNRDDRQNFARYYPRRLPAEVLLDAIGTLTGRPETFDGLPKSFRATQLPDEGFLSPFLTAFGRPKRESVCECERSPEANLSQGLLLLNSPELQRQLAASGGRASTWAANARPDSANLEELYRLAFSRPPTRDERDICLTHLARRREQGRLKEGYEDLIWTVVNTKEFLFNW
jgi:hypothetical protein